MFQLGAAQVLAGDWLLRNFTGRRWKKAWAACTIQGGAHFGWLAMFRS
jgi:hypothetical protein